MDQLYHQTNLLVQHTQELFKSLENSVNNYADIERDIQEKINQINR